jgi:hypothetical protein
MNCSDCDKWVELSDQHGRCRALPPRCEVIPVQGIGGQGMSVVTFWPETKPIDWCASHTVTTKLRFPDLAQRM